MRIFRGALEPLFHDHRERKLAARCLRATRGLEEKGRLFFLYPDTGADDKMSTTDKAQQKLVDSMCKTKAGSAETPELAKKPAGTKPASSRYKRKVSATKTAKTGPRRGTAITGQGGADPYQAGPRVWPD